MKTTTIEALKRNQQALYDAVINIGIQFERTRINGHLDIAILYGAPLRSVKDAVTNGIPLVNIEAVHDHYIEAVDREEQAELEAVS